MNRRLKRLLLPVFGWVLAASAQADPLADGKAQMAKEMAALGTLNAQRVAKLDGGYRVALEKLHETVREEGVLEKVLAVKAELDRLTESPGTAPEGPSPLAELADLQGKYVTTLTRYGNDLHTGRVDLLRGYLSKFGALQRALTKQGKIDAAIAVRDEIEALKATPIGELASLPAVGPGGKPPDRRGLAGDFTLYYSFDEAEDDGQVLDKSDNELHGRGPDGAWLEEGKRGGGFDFTGRASIEIPNNELFEPESFTIAVWINLKEASAFGRIWDKFDYFGRKGYALVVDQFKPIFDFWAGDGTRFQLRAQDPLPAGEWHHVALTFAPGVAVLYVDGKPVNTNRKVKTIKGTTDPVRIGLDEFRALRGHMDELLFYPRALSEHEIRGVLLATEK